MSETSPRRVLHLVVGDMPSILSNEAAVAGVTTEILVLTEKNAPEALEKIFAADSVAVWGDVKLPGR